MVLFFLVSIMVIILFPTIQTMQIYQNLLLFGIPPLLGWLAFHGLLLNRGPKAECVRTPLRRLPQAWTTADLARSAFLQAPCPRFRENSNRFNASMFLRAEHKSDGTRAFLLTPRRTRSNIYGHDLYRRIIRSNPFSEDVSDDEPCA